MPSIEPSHADSLSSQVEKEVPANSKTTSTVVINESPSQAGVNPWNSPGTWGAVRRGWRIVQRYIWDDPDKSAAEKKFLLKLDFFLLSYTCLGYFCKNLDQANINNAYVSGMKEALGLYGSELTYAGNVFTAGCELYQTCLAEVRTDVLLDVVGQLPAVILVTKLRPSILVSSMEILWAVFTFCSAAVTNASQLYALRFLVGLCEGAFFPVIIYVISSWCMRPSSFLALSH